MDEYSAFFLRNWPLSLAFLLTFIVIIIVELREKTGGPNSVNSTDAIQCLNHQKGVVIDLRSAHDFGTGHIVDAVNVEAASLKESVKKLKRFANRPLIVVDHNGRGTREALTFLKTEGFTVYALAGGMEAWLRDELPITTKR